MQSSSQNLFGTAALNQLLPSHTYGVNYGGDPKCIPDLTWEQLKSFHASHYHPSNSRSVLSLIVCHCHLPNARSVLSHFVCLSLSSIKMLGQFSLALSVCHYHPSNARLVLPCLSVTIIHQKLGQFSLCHYHPSNARSVLSLFVCLSLSSIKC